MFRYDHHVHIASPKILEEFRRQEIPDFWAGTDDQMTAQGVLSWLDRAGMDRAVILSSGFSWGNPLFALSDEELEARTRAENTWAAAQRNADPDRLKCLMSFHPLHTKSALREMARCRDELGMEGIKLHFNACGVDILDPEHLDRLRPVFREAGRRSLPILLHYGIQDEPNSRGSITPDALDVFMEELLLPHPGLKVQFAHGIGIYSEATETPFRHLCSLRKARPEIRDRTWTDISATLVDEATERHYSGLLKATPGHEFKRIAERLRAFGLDHVLFGSDFYASPTLNPLDYSRFVKANLPLTSVEMEKLFSNPGPFWAISGQAALRSKGG